MSYERPGAATYHLASRPTMHGSLTVEDGKVGRAVKQDAYDPDSARDANRALIATGVRFVIRGLGLYRGKTTAGEQFAPLAGAALGSAVYMTNATGAISTTPGAGKTPVGTVSATPTSPRPTPAGEVEIDLNDRGLIPTA